MEKLSLKFWECMQLANELAGVTNQQTGEVSVKGMLNEKVNLVTKYWLMDLLNKVNAIKQDVDKLREEMIKKYGETGKNGEVFIPIYEDEKDAKKEDEASTSAAAAETDAAPKTRKVNPNFEQFQKEYSALLEQDKEIEYKPIPIDALKNVETESNYLTIMKLVKPE